MDNTLENYLKELEKIPLISPDEEAALAQRVSDGDEDACTRYTEGNLSLVVSIVKEYEPFVKNLHILDLIQAGNLGLMKAVEKFDYTKDCNFSEYAIQFIRQSIIDAIAHDS